MSQRDYELIAATLKHSRELRKDDQRALAVIDGVIIELGARLQAAHKGCYPFKMQKFLEASGYQAEQEAV